MEISKPLGVSGQNLSYGIVRKPNVRFSGNLSSDTFEVNSLKKYTSEYYLKKAVEENPEIKAILAEVNIPCKLNMDVLEELLSTHAKTTRETADGIISNLQFSLKTIVDKNAVDTAAYLHDLGKVLIPAEIVNKNGKLNEAEQNIMHKHSELGYELLKGSNLDKKVLNLIRNHHQNAARTGYPIVDNMFFADINQQIVSLADKYAALTEKRPYKDCISGSDALKLIYEDVESGKYNRLIYNALVKYSQSLSGKNLSTIPVDKL